jgi:hypothetical protein
MVARSPAQDFEIEKKGEQDGVEEWRSRVRLKPA